MLRYILHRPTVVDFEDGGTPLAHIGFGMMAHRVVQG
jgi:hypothetical protein